jgi:hypothetical protein
MKRKVFSGERFPDGDRPADKETFQIVEHGANARASRFEGGDGCKDGTEISEGAAIAE